MQSLDASMRSKVQASPFISVSKRVSPELVAEIIQALKSVTGYGSIEIYVQDHSVTQITIRNIKKTKHILAE